MFEIAAFSRHGTITIFITISFKKLNIKIWDIYLDINWALKFPENSRTNPRKIPPPWHFRYFQLQYFQSRFFKTSQYFQLSKIPKIPSSYFYQPQSHVVKYDTNMSPVM